MAFTPTLWNASDKGYNASISGGGLVYTTDQYSQNRVRAVYGADDGKWYWEVTVTAAGPGALPRFGVYAASASITDNFPGDGEYSTGAISNGDVFGIALDVASTSVVVRKNGTIVSTIASLPGGEVWHPSISDSGTLGGDTVFTANFGASAFAYTPPAGFEEGIGGIAIAVTGTKETRYGTPIVFYPPVIKGILLTKYGTLTAAQKFPVDTQPPSTRYGAPHLKFNQVGSVLGTLGTSYGVPTLAIVFPPMGAICRVEGTLVTQYGTPNATGAVTVQATGTRDTQYGTPISGRGYPATGTTSTHYGTPMMAWGLQVVGQPLTKTGMPVLRMGQPIKGACSTRYGIARALAASVHGVTGTCSTRYGAPRVGMTHPVRSLPPVARYGRPTLQAQPC